MVEQCAKLNNDHEACFDYYRRNREYVGISAMLSEVEFPEIPLHFKFVIPKFTKFIKLADYTNSTTLILMVLLDFLYHKLL